MKNFNKKNKEEGYAILIIIVILSASSLIITTSLLIWGYYFNKTSLDLEESNQAMGLADACAEAALQEIRNDENYTGTDGFSLSTGSCTFTVSGASPNKTIQATGTADLSIRKVRITTDQINPTINITLWEEVANF